MVTILHIPNKLIEVCYSQWGLNKWNLKRSLAVRLMRLKTKGIGSKDPYRFVQEISLATLGEA